MTRTRRLNIAVMALALTALAARAYAGAPQVMNPQDTQAYAQAFQSVERGDFVDATLKILDVSDPSLTGYVAFGQLMHPKAHISSYEELDGWLGLYGELPLAERVASLAAKRKTAADLPTNAPTLSGPDWTKVELVPPGTGGPFDRDNARLARLAFYAGDTRRALDLAKAVGDRWIAGMAAYRLKQYPAAEHQLSGLIADSSQDVWVRAGAAYWAARAAGAQGGQERASTYLRQAASAPTTFYGMIAERQSVLNDLGQSLPFVDAPTAGRGLIRATYAPKSDVDLGSLVINDPRAHRAAALAQIGRADDAAAELRAGLFLAKSPAERGNWSALAAALNAALDDKPEYLGPITPDRDFDYPTPSLNPRQGFTVSKALVYAIVRQESRFRPGVVSPAGAVGLMQLMPGTAAHASGNARFQTDASSLFDPSLNLKIGQDYVSWLMSQGVGYDILRTVAAYNGGPATLQKTAQMLGEDDESLMVIECMPAPETRDYVEKVMAAYWTYRKKFGQDVTTLDMLASGQKYVDARWDTEPDPVVMAPVKVKRSPKSRRHSRRA